MKGNSRTLNNSGKLSMRCTITREENCLQTGENPQKSQEDTGKLPWGKVEVKAFTLQKKK